MTIAFTKEEQKYIVMDKGNWKVSTSCPDTMRVKLQKKLDMLYCITERSFSDDDNTEQRGK